MKSAETPIGNHESNGVVAREGANLTINEGLHASTSYECTIMYSAPTEQLVIRPHIVPLLPTFHGMESENPYAHIKEFEDAKEYPYECWERYMEAIMLVLTMLLIHGYWRSGKMKSQPNAFHAKAGMYTLNEEVDMKAKFCSYGKKIGGARTEKDA
ncbi:hypothetical protein CK203_044667 [Vitis vinifera]|uniref:Uncharacterized protein n=1 Tax=Vitis vinifera TaxID=29760 RepID=A0A438H9B9_VITVI|nr:hypothetical protein CK203_044667 [Vitis vinifera]